MSTAAQETAFYDAVQAAEGVRQSAKAAAGVTYNFVQANFAAYVTALVAADVAFANSIATAATAAGVNPYVVQGPVPAARWAKIGGH